MGKTYTVTLIKGDGTGPELAAAARKCIDVALAATPGAGAIDWRPCEAGGDIMANRVSFIFKMP